jgi:hypothetical protein
MYNIQYLANNKRFYNKIKYMNAIKTLTINSLFNHNFSSMTQMLTEKWKLNINIFIKLALALTFVSKRSSGTHILVNALISINLKLIKSINYNKIYYFQFSPRIWIKRTVDLQWFGWS